MSALLFKKMMLLWRTIGMLTCVLTGVAVLSLLFRWFPIDDLTAWVAYLLSFALCVGSISGVMVWKTRRDDVRVKQKLAEYKKQKQEQSALPNGER